jgi:type II secretory pathway component GspD/PulD (secretin)
MNKMSSSCYCVIASLFLASTTSLIAQEAVPIVEATKPKEVTAPASVPVAPPVAPPTAPTTPAKALAVDAPITLTFDNTPLLDVIKAFRDTTGVNLITAGTNLNSMAVSMRLDNVPWKQGLDSILIPQGLEAVEQPTGSGIYIIRNKSTAIPKFTKAFKLGFARSADVAQLFRSAFDLSMPVGAAPTPLGASVNGTVSAFPSANTVIVTASQQQLDECEKILSQIDVQRPQVYIEARFVEVSSGASKKLGLKWDNLGTQNGWGASFTPNMLDDITSTTWLGPEVAGDVTAALVAGDVGLLSIDSFRLAMNLFEQMDGVTTFSNPRVIVGNEEQATIDMTRKEPNVTIRSTRTGTQMDQLDITSELQVIPGKVEMNVGEAFFSYGITLKVTPRVSPTGLITVVIEPAISSKIAEYEIISAENRKEGDPPLPRYPIIDMKRINTTFTMNDGYTAVIGGLSKTEEDSVDNGIPYLRSIPYVGEYLFGWKSRVKTQKEIIIFVSVGIADPATMKKDAGLPKNAVVGREFVNGERKEPGDQSKAEFLKLNLKQHPHQ